jgi:hypothetical protein
MANTDGERAEGPCVSPSVYHKSRQENRKNYVMTKPTPTFTLTQSGPLAVLRQRQRDAVIQLDRHAHRKHMRAAFWKTLTWPFRALTARTLVDYTWRRQQIHDDLRIQHPEWVEAAHGDPDRLRWRRTSIRQASEKLWGVA